MHPSATPAPARPSAPKPSSPSVIGKVLAAKRGVEAQIEAKTGACPLAAVKAAITCGFAVEKKVACFTAMATPNPVSITTCVVGQFVSTPSCVYSLSNAMNVCYENKAK
jgi:hypothetical protein